MDSNPYAPPRAVVADLNQPALKRRSILLMIVFFVLTLGLYYPFWYLRRRAALNQLDSPKKLRLWPFVLYGIYILLEFIAGFAYADETIDPGVRLVLNLIQLAIGILMIVQSFIVKDILEDHLIKPEDPDLPAIFVERVKLSGLATFFLSIFYLQWAINRYIVGSRAESV